MKTSLGNTLVALILLTAPLASSPAQALACLTRWGSPGAGAGQFASSCGVAVDAVGRVDLTDGDNNRIQVFAADSTYLRQFGGYDAPFIAPWVVAVTPTGDRIAVTDAWCDRYHVFSADGTLLQTVGSLGSVYGQLHTPSGIAIGPNGHVYVDDTAYNRVEEFDANGSHVGSLGGFHHPFGVIVDASGQIYVADRDNNRICAFTAARTFLRQWGSLGLGPGKFNGPCGVAVLPGGDVVVADTYNHRLQLFDPNGNFLAFGSATPAGTPPLGQVRGVAADVAGDIFADDDSRIVLYGLGVVSARQSS